jgi:hypothetical protein
MAMVLRSAATQVGNICWPSIAHKMIEHQKPSVLEGFYFAGAEKLLLREPKSFYSGPLNKALMPLLPTGRFHLFRLS